MGKEIIILIGIVIGIIITTIITFFILAYNEPTFSTKINYLKDNQIITNVVYDNHDLICQDTEGVSWICAENVFLE